MKKIITACLSAALLLAGIFMIEKMKQETFLVNAVAENLIISEVVTANGSNPDYEGEYSDWIELYYSGDQPLNLSGYYLSDDPQKSRRWKFPDVDMMPDSYLVIYASGKDCVTDSGEIHTNFKLDYLGETLVLSEPNGRKVIDLQVPEIPFDHSYGEKDGNYVIFESGSLGRKNKQPHAMLTKATEAVQYSKASGVYEDEIFLEFSTTEKEAYIYYSLDGSIPTKRSLKYEGESLTIRNRTEEENRYTSVWSSPFDWDGQEGFSYNPNPQYKATVVKTRLYFPEENVWSKDVWTNTYLIGAEYQLSVISLSVEESELFDEDTGLCVPGDAYEYYMATAEEIDPEPRLRTGNYSANRKVAGYLEYFEENGQRVLSQQVTLRMAGNLSRGNGMKSFIVNAWGSGENGMFSYPVFGEECTDINGQVIEQFTSLRLRNFGNDWRRSKFRDALSQSLVSELDLGTQAYQPAILLINGEYYGLVEVRENRDDLFFEKHFGILNGDYEEVEIKNLSRETATESGHEFLDLIEYAETYDLSDEKYYEYVNSRLDIPQFLDYILVQLYLQNIDWYENNCMFYRSTAKDGKWRVLLYDLDYAINYQEENNYEKFCQSDYYTSRLFRALMQNEACKSYYIQRFEELLNDHFESSGATAMQKSFEQQIEGYIQEDLARWDVYHQGTVIKSIDIDYWYEKMEDLRQFFIERPEYAREYFYASLGTLEP